MTVCCLASLAGTAALCCLGLAGAAAAENIYSVPIGYTLATEGEHGAHFVHVDSIRRDGGFLEAWVLRNLAELQLVDGTEFFSALILTRFDCERRRAGAIVIHTYAQHGATGRIVSSSEVRDEAAMDPLVPGTVGDDVLEFVCAHG